MCHKAGRGRWVLQNGPDSHLFYMLLVRKKVSGISLLRLFPDLRSSLASTKALVFTSSTKENGSGEVTTNRAPVVFCPQRTPSHFSDNEGLKPTLIPTPVVSGKLRPYSLHILGIRQPWLTCMMPFSRERRLLHSYLTPLQKTSQVT